jgi:hypothetical protein
MVPEGGQRGNLHRVAVGPQPCAWRPEVWHSGRRGDPGTCQRHGPLRQAEEMCGTRHIGFAGRSLHGEVHPRLS